MQAGDRVLAIKGKRSFEGTLMPSTMPGVVVLKLDSGYNLGIKGAKVKLLETHKHHPVTHRHIDQKDLPAVTILHTGGTIASKVDYKTGAAIPKFDPEDLLELMPELLSVCKVKSILVAKLLSASMRFGHYNLIAKAIEKELKNNPKGVIITHGTDTMHFTAAALSFMLENINIPVILVGAQRSSDRGSSDAAMNLTCAAKFIANSDFKGVAICMHSSSDDDSCVILPACKSRKFHTSRRDAFKAVNDRPIALVDYKSNSINFLRQDYYRPPQGKTAIRLFKAVKVGLLKTHTNMYPENYLHFKNYDGLVIEGTGLGHAQIVGFDDISEYNEKNKKALGEVSKKAVVVMASQCIYGRVNMNIYSYGREALKLGITGAEDMTPETAFIKLAWLLSNYPKSKVRELMVTNLRGEITEKTIITA